MARKTPGELRSHRWFGVEDIRAFGHRSRMLQAGYSESDFRGKPVIGIINTWSELSPCHFHFRTRAEEVKRGVWQASVPLLSCPATICPATARSRVLPWWARRSFQTLIWPTGLIKQ